MGKAAYTARSILSFVLSLASTAFAIAIVYLISRRLYKYNTTTDIENRDIDVEVECGLDPDGLQKRDLCYYGFAGVGLTFAILLATGLLLCFTCNCCNTRLGPTFAFIAQAVLCVGWALYASWVTDAVRQISNNEPEWNTDDIKEARGWVVGLSWAEAVAFGAMAVLSLLTGLCCPPGGKDSSL